MTVSNGARRLALERNLDIEQIKRHVLAHDPTARVVMREHVLTPQEKAAEDTQRRNKELATETQRQPRAMFDPSDRVRGETGRLQTGQGETAQQTLCCAASAGDAARLTSLLSRKTNPYNPHSRDKQGRTALGLACAGGHLDAARVLLDCGAGANTPNRDKETPLLIAAAEGHTWLVRLLLDRGALVDHRGIRNCSALMWGAIHGRAGVVRCLLKAGAQISVHDIETIKNAVRRQRQAESPQAECVRLLARPLRWRALRRLARVVGIAAQCFRLVQIDVMHKRYMPGAPGAIATQTHFEEIAMARATAMSAGDASDCASVGAKRKRSLDARSFI